MTGLYIHIPFCQKKCIYCHFASGIPYDEERASHYIDLLLQEAYLYKQTYGHLAFHTLYLGGGTPSLLSSSLFHRLIEGISSLFTLETQERTIEVNPEHVTKGSLTLWKDLGFDRISLGFQSIQPEILRFLSRSPFDPETTYNMIKDAGFSKLNVDFIVGIPELNTSSLLSWIEKHLPSHLSLYLLSCEEGSTLAGLAKRKAFHIPDPDFQAQQYLDIAGQLSQFYEWYEISNFALGTKNRAIHNTLYWKYEPYIGLGIGASGFLSWKNFRYNNTVDLCFYENALKEKKFPYGYTENIDPKTTMIEKLMLALRTSDGIDMNIIREWINKKNESQFMSTLQLLSSYCYIDQDKLILTPEGRLVANSVITEIWNTIEQILSKKNIL
ncbi:MAG: coproporphyrinogen-III oxidase family protein [Brevinematales bacterium]